MIAIVTASPNQDGLTAACGQAALRGVERAGAQAELIDLFATEIKLCMACSDGWGICRTEHRCFQGDGLNAAMDELAAADALVLVTPVYWWQPSERMKAFLDRVRRCQAMRGPKGALEGKRIALVAAAGRSGNGTVECLQEMEMWCRHVGAQPTERVGVTRFTREPMLKAIEIAAYNLSFPIPPW